MRKDDLVFVGCLLFLLGIASGGLFPNPSFSFLVVFIIAAVLILFFSKQHLLPIIFLLPLFALGSLRFISDHQTFLTTIKSLNGKYLFLKGTVSDIQAFDNFSVITLDNPIGKFSFINKQTSAIKYGDQISVSGIFEKPKEDKINYYYSQHLLGDLKSPKNLEFTPSANFNFYYWLQNLKVKEKAKLVEIFNNRKGHLLSGLVFGESDQFSDDEKVFYKRVGVYHLVALSGEQISLVALFIFFVLGIFIHRKKAAIFAGCLLLIYLLSTSLAASALRAYLMFLIYLGSLFFERLNSARNVIFLSAALLTLFNPSFLLFNLGFELSYIALISLIYLFPYLKTNFFPHANKFIDLFIITFSVELMIAPLLFLYFGYVNFLGILNNPLILWSSPVLFILAIGSLFSFYLMPFLLPAFYFLTNLICDYFFFVLDSIDHLFSGLNPNLGALEIIYLLLGLVVITIFQKFYASRTL